MGKQSPSQAFWYYTGNMSNYSTIPIIGQQDNTDQPLTITKQRNVDMDNAAKEHWTLQQQNSQWTSIQFARESWCIFLGKKKQSTNLKYKLIDHTAGWEARTYWAGKTVPGHKHWPGGLDNNRNGHNRANNQYEEMDYQVHHWLLCNRKPDVEWLLQLLQNMSNEQVKTAVWQ